MSKRIIIVPLIFFVILILSACSNESQIEAQKQKELDIISAQKTKEIDVEKFKESLSQEKENKLNACFKAADDKKIKDTSFAFHYYCGVTKLEDANKPLEIIVKNCLNSLPLSKQMAWNASLQDVSSENKNSREECLKIYSNK